MPAQFTNIFSIIIALLVFSLLVTAHEFGHFIVAKKNGIMVKEFAVGMGPIVVAKQFGETLYSIRLLPLGGFCSMLGEDESSHDERAFNNKSVLSRIAVVAAGPLMNFIFAFLIVFFLISTSFFREPVVTDLIDDFPAKAAGMEIGDRITRVNNEKVNIFQDLQFALSTSTGENIEVTVDRKGEKKVFNIKPQYSDDSGAYILGFISDGKAGMFVKDTDGFEKASFFDTLKTSCYTMVFYVKSTVIGFVRLFTLNIKSDEIMGPIGITQVVSDSFEEGLKSSAFAALQNMAGIAALLSVNLGAINLFPIPAMDGGRLVFLFIEAIRKKPLNREKEGFVHFAGFVLLMALMAYVAFNDITRLL